MRQILIHLAFVCSTFSGASAQTPRPPRPAAATVPLAWSYSGSGVAMAPTPAWNGPGVWALAVPEQGTPEDSLYRLAREALSRGDYLRAAESFQTFQQRFPKSRFVPAALYWQAFARYRVGTEVQLRAAQEALARMRAAQEALAADRTRYVQASAEEDVASLTARIQAALAARGDARAAAQLQAAAQQTTCDREEMEVRAEALNALVEMDEAGADALVKRVLARRDDCSVLLRRRAVYIIGRKGGSGAVETLATVAREDPNTDVRRDAISMLGRIPGAETHRMLEAAVRDPEPRLARAAISALGEQDTPESRSVLQRLVLDNNLDDELRTTAVSALVSRVGRGSRINIRGYASDRVFTVVPSQRGRVEAEAAQRLTPAAEQVAAFLRQSYAAVTARRVRQAMILGIGSLGGESNQRWLLDLAQNPQEESPYRSDALSSLNTSGLTAADLAKLYDGMTDRRLREALIGLLGRRDEPEAVDKLIDIARNGTDPSLRRHAISVLARKNDPRATKLLLELVEKP